MIRLAFFALLTSAAGMADFDRMSVQVKYKQQRLRATFFTRSYPPKLFDESGMDQLAPFLEAARIKRYLEREGKVSPAVLSDWIRNYFRWMRVEDHDEILVYHRDGSVPGNPPGIGEVVGLFAVKRTPELLERRLAPIGFRMDPPTAYPWWGPELLPQGDFVHWHPGIARDYFIRGQVFLGATIHANCMFADDGLGALVEETANAFGLFVGPMTHKPGETPRVYKPTLTVWEVFNHQVGEQVKKGSRTILYERLGAEPIHRGQTNQWQDPRLAKGNLVQVMSRGYDIREIWTARFEKMDGFSFVRDVEFSDIAYETVDADGTLHRRIPEPEMVKHLPRQLGPCIEDILAARSDPPTLRSIAIRLQVNVNGISTPTPVMVQTHFAGSRGFTPRLNFKVQVGESSR